MPDASRRLSVASIVLVPALAIASVVCIAQTSASLPAYSANIAEGGAPLVKQLPEAMGNLSQYSLLMWLKADRNLSGKSPVVVLGNGLDATRLLIDDGHAVLQTGHRKVSAHSSISAGGWHQVVALVQNGNVRLYVDGMEDGQENVGAKSTAGTLTMAPLPKSQETRFHGEIGLLVLHPGILSAQEIRSSFEKHDNFDLQLREENAKSWPLQKHQQAGYTAPQPPDTLPRGAATAMPVAKPLPDISASLVTNGQDGWDIVGGWNLLNSVHDTPPPAEAGAKLSTEQSPSGQWLPATVPGTILTTLVDRGIYPGPSYGLNNMAIPESLNKHDWWYRNTFVAPATRGSQHTWLNFAGINYHADVWLNGTFLGQISGAFHRGHFEVSNQLHDGTNIIAVRISPPPHPGMPHEQSLAGGPGENGGEMVIDGPTFVATEGWDWIPAIRDRNSGIWQSVSLTTTGTVTIGDARVVTRLPLPGISTADVSIDIPLQNTAMQSIPVRITAVFEGTSFDAQAIAEPGDSVVHLSSDKYPQLHLVHPRLWWPNGYGKPELYHLSLSVSAGGTVQDHKQTTFGVRELSYELTLFDHEGRMQRVEAIPQETIFKGYDAVDVHHSGMRQTATGWASTIDPKAEGSSAIRPVSNEPNLTDLVVKVNGVRIAVRGGNWGMDDLLKRVSRDRLEPYFRLHREANLNIVRNWVGQNTEDTFYDLADEYGMLVWNDFWASTQDYNAEPGDTSLFVENARDVVRRYRNHPSILLWCGRNEGVPPPTLNDALIFMLRQEDGTRFYSPSSNVVNLRGSGPYSWEDPALYFSKLNRGFSVELGISSFPTLDAFSAAVPAPDRWPISDTWAYHDWHQKGGGDTHVLMQHLDKQMGAPTDLPDFEKKIQMFNYVDHQAIFEGLYQHLWMPNSGRMIWMTHPAWPSTMWQMYSSDYDTQASFYAIRKANEPLHVQMDLSDGTLAIVNTTRETFQHLHVTAQVISPANDVLEHLSLVANVDANQAKPLAPIHLQQDFESSPLVFVRLELRNENGKLLADNFYWIAKTEGDFRALNQLPCVALNVHAGSFSTAKYSGEKVVNVTLANPSKAVAIEAKLTLFREDNTRVLPAYYSDNYVSLLPGEKRTVSVSVPARTPKTDKLHFTLRGWNISEQTITLKP